jgi:hypothetical protein
MAGASAQKVAEPGSSAAIASFDTFSQIYVTLRRCSIS